MSLKPLRRVVALDGGTTNTRARLLVDGQIVATARRSVGVRDSVLSTRSSPLGEAARDAIGEVLQHGGGVSPDAIVASGMLSSEVGLAAIPHVPAPAGIEELASAAREVTLSEISERPILFIPGVRTPAAPGVDGWAAADVMRGEECETFGALTMERLVGPIVFLWPGSHTKLVEVDAAGRIARSTTSLAGEITSALAGHTLIAASLPDALPESPDPDAAAAGLRLGASEGLGRSAFLVRLAALGDVMTPERRGAFWVGAVVGGDAAHLARHPILSGGLPLVVGGREPLRGLYARALRGA
ncbi:MAG: 2-dehydro-3-deoxygalactonokinase, partial [Isosphaeraceae bacterium]